MAGHLARAGHAVTVYNRTAAKAEAWAPRNTAAAGRAHAAQAARRGRLRLRLRRQRRRPALGGAGRRRRLRRHEAGRDLRRPHHGLGRVARELHARPRRAAWASSTPRCRAARPVRVNGALTVMCGGDAAAFDAMKPVAHGLLARRHAGGRPAPASWPRWSTRSASPAWCRACPRPSPSARRPGLDMKQVLDVIGKGAAQSWQMDNRGKTMVDDQFDFGFAVDWMRKDLGLVLDEARRNGARLPVTALVDQFYGDVQRMGGGRWDTSSLIRRLIR
jgi:3-hydroxyisobutyrate dehydrogenase